MVDDLLLLQSVLLQFAEAAVEVGEGGATPADLRHAVLLLCPQRLQFLTFPEQEFTLPLELSVCLLHGHGRGGNESYYTRV